RNWILPETKNINSVLTETLIRQPASTRLFLFYTAKALICRSINSLCRQYGRFSKKTESPQKKAWQLPFPQRSL
ncbi:MAG: hypothetical protein KY428_09520, partial [Bacteroidetes bacterium]|nr:hypothetical protein [Bacteroidota bacterium]